MNLLSGKMVNVDKSQSSVDWERIKKAVVKVWLSAKENVVLALLDGMPTMLGRLLRGALYPTIFEHLGKSSVIRPRVQFFGTHRIEMGDFVSLHPGVRIRSLNHKSSISLANKVSLDIGVDIKSNCGRIKIGNRAYIGPYTCLSGGDISIGDNCLIASHSGIYANNHEFYDADRKIIDQGSSFKGIIIEEDCWLGSGVRVLDGVTISKGSVIGAGAVVTKDIPPYSVAVGVPAKVISQRKAFSEKSPDQLLKDASTPDPLPQPQEVV